MRPREIIDLRPKQPAIGLPPGALIDAAAARVQRCYADTCDPPAAFLFTVEQWTEIEKHVKKCGGGDWPNPEALQLWGVPVEVLGRFPRFVGGPFHGVTVPPTGFPSYGTYAPPDTVDYYREVASIFGERLEFWTCLSPDEALPLLGRELLRAAARAE